MIRVDIEQGSDLWHRERYRKIGGTLSKDLFVNSDTLLIKVLSQLLEDFQHVDGYVSDEMLRGIELEPYALKSLIKYSGLNFGVIGWLQCEEIPILGISPDGITKDDRFSCEIKCPSSKRHTETILYNEIPKDNIHQCLHYFTVNPNLERHLFASFRPENNIKPLFVKELTRDTIIDLGLKKKVEVEVIGKKGVAIKPKTKVVADLKTVNEWVAIAKEAARDLQSTLDLKLKELEF